MPETQTASPTAYPVPGGPASSPTNEHIAVRPEEILWNVVLAKASEYISYSSSSVSASVQDEMQQSLRLSGVLQNYLCEDVADVHSFLSAHPHLVPLLEEAPLAIRQIYGPCALKLDVLHDPEEGWSRLFLVVKSPLDIHSLLQRSELFGEQWIIPRLATFGSDFSVTEEPA